MRLETVKKHRRPRYLRGGRWVSGYSVETFKRIKRKKRPKGKKKIRTKGFLMKRKSAVRDEYGRFIV